MLPPKKRLGELLQESNLITHSQLEEALKVQKDSGERLGKVLIELGYVTEQDIINVLEFQLGIKQVTVIADDLDPETVKLIPEALARRHMVVATKLTGRTLTVAMVDPLNVVAIDDLRLATGYEIEPVIASESDIEKAIQKIYGMGQLPQEALYQLEDSGEVPSRREIDLDQLTESLSGEAPVVRIVNTLIQQAVQVKASDIHVEPQEDKVRIRFRIDGMLREIMNLPRGSLASLVSRIKIMAEMDIAEKRLPQDGRIQIKLKNRHIDLRVSSLPTVFGEKIVMRILDKANVLVDLDRLGFQQDILKQYRKLISRPYGMILVTGPTGSGKTTTLYATLSEINTMEKNILSIEDPVEYILEGINQTGINPKAGLTFASGLRSILRQDPDVVMVGEIRDSETAQIAVRAATTGHLVFSTLHTNDSAGSVTRLVDMGVEPFLVASSVIAVLAQRLVRMICPYCREKYEVPNDAPERLFLGIPAGEKLELYRARGCSSCDRTGFSGRTAIHELLVLNSDLRELIIGKTSSEEIKKAAMARGMLTLREDGIQKALQGITTLDEVMRVAFMGESF